MASRHRFVVLGVLVLCSVALALPSIADHQTRPNTSGLTPLGEAPNVTPGVLTAGVSEVNTDAAFWGDFAVEGSWKGFRVIDLSDPANPEQIYFWKDCDQGQGDVIIWQTLVFRAYQGGTAGRICGTDDTETPIPATVQGVYIFDIAKLLAKRDNPGTIVDSDVDLLASVAVAGGAHTETLVPDLANNRLLVYGNPSGSTTQSIIVIEVPLNNPSAATQIRTINAGRSCHDVTVFLGSKNRMACSGSISGLHGYAYFSMDAADGGSLDDPMFLYEKNFPGTSTIGHTTGFTADGEQLIWSHEPGGGTGAQCQANQPAINRRVWFLEAESGTIQGHWDIPPQTSTENCASIHIMNTIPTTSGRDIMVSGNYQGGTYVVDFTDPANPVAIGWSDPEPENPAVLSTGGAWATYWYNGFAYESHITKGFHAFRINDPGAATSVVLPHSTPQTVMELAKAPAPTATCRGQKATIVGTQASDTLVGTDKNDVIAGLGRKDKVRAVEGDDLVCGGGGRDKIKGGPGFDRLRGQRGNDRAAGHNGNDNLNGGPGKRDACIGGEGKDAARGCEKERTL